MGTLRRQSDGTRVFLSAEHIVGRLSSCHLPLAAAFISSAHALVRWTGESWEVRDLGSTNGTFVEGNRLDRGASARVKRGESIVFGEPSETWRLDDDRPPVAAAVPEDGGEPSFFSSGVIAIPSTDEPLATIYCEGQADEPAERSTGLTAGLAWALEYDEVKSPLIPGQRFQVGGRSWRFECPNGATVTRALGARPKRLADVTLTFEISQNQEYVSLKVKEAQTVHDLGIRACFYLAYVLYQERTREHDSALPAAGWLDVEAVMRKVKDYNSHSHLNVEIFRLRRLLYDAGVEDAASIIERRRGQLRFGAQRAEVVRVDQPAAPGMKARG